MKNNAIKILAAEVIVALMLPFFAFCEETLTHQESAQHEKTGMRLMMDTLHQNPDAGKTPENPTRPVYPTMITAHAGAEDTAPNTLESLKVLLAIGADAVEVDVRKKDGVLCLSHDEPAPGKTYRTLGEAFELLKTVPHVKLNLDIKTPGLIMDVLQLARASGVAHRLLMTGDVGPDDYEIILNNEIPLWMNQYILPVLEWMNPVEAAEKRGFYVVNIDKRMLTGPMLRQQAGRFSVWTVNDEETLRRLLAAGVKNITTRSPLLALRLRGEIQKPQAQ